MWTRNYRNIIYTNAICQSVGLNGYSSNAFGDNYFGNFKDPNGSLREIATYPASSGGLGGKGTFVSCSSQASKTYISTPSTITSQTDSIKGSFTPNILKVGFGSSATPESFDDYALESIISDYLTKSATGVITANADGTFTIDYQILISATADITIQEIGLFLPTSYQVVSNSSVSHGYYALINRIVLDKPVTIANGSVGNITFSITTPKITIR